MTRDVTKVSESDSRPSYQDSSCDLGIGYQYQANYKVAFSNKRHAADSDVKPTVISEVYQTEYERILGGRFLPPPIPLQTILLLERTVTLADVTEYLAQ